jgi:ABC-type nitrate/sulfonate/bicarbonate transport system substrate-binding protein
MEKRGETKLIKTVVILIIIGILVGGYYLFANQKQQFTDSSTYTFGGSKNINVLPIIAKHQGYFRKYGLNMERKDTITAAEAKEQLVNGEIDFATIVDTNIGFTFEDIPNIEVIAVIEEKFDDVIIADASIKNPKDLEGKKLAITPFTTNHAFAVFYLINNRVDLSKVEFIHMSPPEIREALLNGEIDAGSIWQPGRYDIIKERKNQVRTFNDPLAYTAFVMIGVQKSFSKDNPEVVENFLKALLDSEEYVKNNLEETQNIMSEELGIPLSTLVQTWDEYIFDVSLGQELVLTLEDEARWAIKNDLVEADKIPNYLDYIYIDALEEIKPEAVTIIR